MSTVPSHLKTDILPLRYRSRSWPALRWNRFSIPEPLQREHEALHEELRRVTEAGGEGARVSS